MAPTCCICDTEFNSQNGGLSCSGPCKKSFHFSCADLPPQLAACMKKCKRIYWKCEECQNYTSAFNITDLQNMMEEKFATFSLKLVQEFDEKLTVLKSELKEEMSVNTKNLVDQSNELCLPGTSKDPTSYAAVAERSRHSKVLVKPKNEKQNIKETKTDIMKSADPVKHEVNVKKVKIVKNGGMVLECKNPAESKKLAEVMKGNLQQNYTITELSAILPKVRISGLSQAMDKEVVETYVPKQNEGLFSENSVFNVISIDPFKKNPSYFNVLAECDALLYKKLLDRSHILIGVDGCSVHDAFTLRRCFNCNGFNHISKYCPTKDKITCPLCAGVHNLKECKSTQNSFSCSNCLHHNSRFKTDFKTDHAVWEYDKCDSYKISLSKVKFDLFGICETK